MNNQEYNFDPMTGERINKPNTQDIPNNQNVQNTQNVYGQNVCQKPQRTQSSVVLIAVIAVTIVIIGVMSTVAGYFLISGNERAEKPTNPLLTEAITMSDVSLGDGNIPATYSMNMPTTVINGVGTKASIIEKLRTNTDKSLNSMSTSDIGDGTKYYTLEGQILRVDIQSGINGFNYNRSYYFNNGVLYFAYIYSPSYQNSLYFYKGEMYRYIDEKGEMKQNEFKDNIYKTLGNFALNEAYSFYDYKVGVKSGRE